MPLLPNKHVILRSPLIKAEVIKKISQNTRIMPLGSFPARSQGFSEMFSGMIMPDGFSIRPVIKQGRNSFIPFITGDVREVLSGSEITLDLKLHTSVKIFITVWLSICALACVGILWTSFQQQSFEAVAVIPFIMLAFGFTLTHLAFTYSANEAIIKLKELLSATEKTE